MERGREALLPTRAAFVMPSKLSPGVKFSNTLPCDWDRVPPAVVLRSRIGLWRSDSAHENGTRLADLMGWEDRLSTEHASFPFPV